MSDKKNISNTDNINYNAVDSDKDTVCFEEASENSAKSGTAKKKKSPSAEGGLTVKKTRSFSKKEVTKEVNEELFSANPDSPATESVTDAQTNSQDESGIEKSATIPTNEAPSLDLLLYDSEEELPDHETPEENAGYENFLVDYKEAIAKALSLAKAEREAREKIENAESFREESIGAEYALAEAKDDNSDGIVFEEDTPIFTDDKPSLEEIFDAPPSSLAEESTELEAEDTSSVILDARQEQSKEEDENREETENITEESEETEGEQLEMDLGVSEEYIKEDETAVAPSEEAEKPDSSSDGEEEHVGFVRSLFEFVELFIFTLVTVMILTTFVFRHSVVDGGSMENTLHNGDHLIISNLFYKPDYGDVVVFSSERNDGSVLVKRVVALEGDEVDCLYANGQYLLYVNNELIDESEYKYVGGQSTVLDEVQDYVVGKGEVFVLGDHRNNSNDSRSFLAVDTDRILGKVILRFYPFEDFGAIR